MASRRWLSMPRMMIEGKENNIHPRAILQRIQLSDGSMIEWTSFTNNREPVTFTMDAGNHPSWNPLSTNSRQFLDEQGSLSKFKQKYGDDLFQQAVDNPSPNGNVEASVQQASEARATAVTDNTWLKSMERIAAHKDAETKLSANERQALEGPVIKKALPDKKKRK